MAPVRLRSTRKKVLVQVQGERALRMRRAEALGHQLDERCGLEPLAPQRWDPPRPRPGDVEPRRRQQVAHQPLEVVEVAADVAERLSGRLGVALEAMSRAMRIRASGVLSSDDGGLTFADITPEGVTESVSKCVLRTDGGVIVAGAGGFVRIYH